MKSKVIVARSFSHSLSPYFKDLSIYVQFTELVKNSFSPKTKSEPKVRVYLLNPVPKST